MRVACPECEAQYEVPDRLIGAGRRLRCARCDHDWLVRAPLPPEPPAEARVPALDLGQAAPGTAAGPAEQRPTAPPGSLALWLAWLASVGAVAAMLAGLWLYRAPLTEFWPPLGRLL